MTKARELTPEYDRIKKPKLYRVEYERAMCVGRTEDGTTVDAYPGDIVRYPLDRARYVVWKKWARPLDDLVEPEDE